MAYGNDIHTYTHTYIYIYIYICIYIYSIYSKDIGKLVLVTQYSI